MDAGIFPMDEQGRVVFATRQPPRRTGRFAHGTDPAYFNRVHPAAAPESALEGVTMNSASYLSGPTATLASAFHFFKSFGTVSECPTISTTSLDDSI